MTIADSPPVTAVIPVSPRHAALVSRAILSAETQVEHIILANDSGAPLEVPGGEYRVPITTIDMLEAPPGWSGGQRASRARNAALELVKSEYVIFLDADDELLPGVIPVLVERLQAEASPLFYVYGDAIAITADNQRGLHKSKDYNPLIFPKHNIHPVTALVPTSAARAVGFNTTQQEWEDWTFYIELYLSGYCGLHVKVPIFTYHLGDGENRLNGRRIQDTLIKRVNLRYSEAIKDRFYRGNHMCGCNNPAPTGGLMSKSNNRALAPNVGLVGIRFVGNNKAAKGYRVSDGTKYHFSQGQTQMVPAAHAQELLQKRVFQPIGQQRVAPPVQQPTATSTTEATLPKDDGSVVNPAVLKQSAEAPRPPAPSSRRPRPESDEKEQEA